MLVQIAFSTAQGKQVFFQHFLTQNKNWNFIESIKLQRKKKGENLIQLDIRLLESTTLVSTPDYWKI